jgi:predicted nucleotidyltransferase
MARKIEKISVKSNLSPLGIRLLTYLARYPMDEFYTKDLASRVEASVSGCHTALAGLLEDDLVTRRKEGGNVYWQARMDNPSVVHFKVFINIQQLRHVVKAVKDLSRRMVLFGSCASGRDTHRSDIDLLVVTSDTEAVSKALRGVLVDGRPVRPVVLTASRLLVMKDDERAIYDEMHKGITLWSDEDERP